jgi:WD40 repeat protein
LVVIHEFDRPVWAIALSPDGTVLAVENDGWIFLLDAVTLSAVRSWCGHTKKVRQVVFRGGGRRLA